MTEPAISEDRPAEPLLHGRVAPQGGIGSTELAAIVLSLLWAAAVAAFFLFADSAGAVSGATGSVMTFVAVFLPIALIWVVATTARTTRELRQEAMRLQGAVDAMRNAYLHQQQQQAAAQGVKSSVEKRLEEIAAAQRQTETAIATFTSSRDITVTVPSADRKAALLAPHAPSPTENEPSLALGTPAEDLRPPISLADFIRGLNFPDNAEDKEGFRTLRLALEDRDTAKLIRAAQDVLTLLAQDGIYMDDLRPDRARPEIWRKFAQGERGRAIAGLGGVRDRSSLALTAGRMRTDPVFRDAAHHFLRQFDRSISGFEANASDRDLAELAETRTARAFMLLGRVTGTFD